MGALQAERVLQRWPKRVSYKVFTHVVHVYSDARFATPAAMAIVDTRERRGHCSGQLEPEQNLQARCCIEWRVYTWGCIVLGDAQCNVHVNFVRREEMKTKRINEKGARFFGTFAATL